MVECPTCKHSNFLGALFCSECGTQLTISGITTQSLKISSGAVSARSTGSDSLPPEIIIKDAPVTLHLLESDNYLPLMDQEEITLGRVNKGQKILPDVDLMPYDAFKKGVSRIHAALELFPGQVRIIDLGSSNGTRVNGEKLFPRRPYSVNNGDILALGKLKIRLVIRRREPG